MNKARVTQESHTDKFHNSMSSLGFEPPNHGVAAIEPFFPKALQVSRKIFDYVHFARTCVPLSAIDCRDLRGKTFT